MKCGFINLVLLGKATLLLIVLFFPLCANVLAQSPQSAQYMFPSLSGDNVIVRDYYDEKVLVWGEKTTTTTAVTVENTCLQRDEEESTIE